MKDKRKKAPNPGPAAGLYQKHRPRSFDGMVGSPAAKTTLQGLFRFPEKTPHAFAFIGASGCGKTTAARIGAARLGATAENFCYTEMDIANLRGIDDMRELKLAAARKPLGGSPASVFTLDEFQMATREAQNVMLKLLEDPPAHAYFIICSTDPHKILPAIMTRCTVVKFEPIAAAELEGLVLRVAKKEGADLGKKVAAKIAEVAEGSARKALVLLEQVMPLKKEEQVAAVVKGDPKAQSIELCRLLLKGKDAPWPQVATILKNLPDDAESVRRHVLGYANAVLLSGNPRGYAVIRAFMYDLFASGKAGLTAACWECRGGR